MRRRGGGVRGDVSICLPCHPPKASSDKLVALQDGEFGYFAAPFWDGNVTMLRQDTRDYHGNVRKHHKDTA